MLLRDMLWRAASIRCSSSSTTEAKRPWNRCPVQRARAFTPDQVGAGFAGVLPVRLADGTGKAVAGTRITCTWFGMRQYAQHSIEALRQRSPNKSR